MLKAEYIVAEQGITIPYPSLFDAIRRNHGFIDLRGRPDLAEKIPEGSVSAALRRLLVSLSESSSTLFTIGCDLGAREEGKHHKTRQIAGGYVQVMASAYRTATPQHYLEFARALETDIRMGSGISDWEFQFQLVPVSFRLDGAEGLTPSLWIWFDAKAETRALASKSRELLIEELRKAVIGRAPVCSMISTEATSPSKSITPAA